MRFSDNEFGPLGVGSLKETELVGPPGGHIGWLVLGHVCTFWRHLLLAQTEFWAGDIGALPLGMPSMLQRAGSQPLTIRSYQSVCGLGHELVLPKLAVMASGPFNHVREIIMIRTNDESTGSGGLFELSNYSFPILESLTVFVYVNSLLALPLQTIHAPRLQKAHLTNYAIALNESDMLRDLTVARLFRGYLDPVMDVATQVKLLRSINSTTLTRLEISNFISGQINDWPPPISFPAMQEWIFRSTHSIGETRVQNYLPLLGGIVLPNAARVTYDVDCLNYTHEDELRESYVQLFKAARIHEVTVTGLRIRDRIVQIQGKPGHRFILLVYTSPPDGASSSQSNSAPSSALYNQFSLRSSYDNDYPNFDKDSQWTLNIVLDALASCTSLDTVHSLTYDGCCRHCEPRVNGSLLSRLPNVCKLQLADAHGGGLLVMASLCNSPMPALPQLKCLTLTQSLRKHVLRRDLLEEQLIRRYATLQRTVPGARLDKLQVAGNINTEGFEDVVSVRNALQSVVDTVDWPGPTAPT